MSNRRALFLGVNININDGKKRVRVSLPPIALCVLRGALSSFDAATELIPGKAGKYARNALGSLTAFVSEIMNAGPCEYVRLNAADSKAKARIRVRTY